MTGRALLDVQVGRPDDVDADFEAALEILERHGDIAGLAFTHSFYAEVAAARGDIDEARRRRRNLLTFYEALPDDPFTEATRSYSRAKLARLDDDLVTAERCYRAAAAAFARIDRPMMHAMTLGMVADFDERAGDFAAAEAALAEAIALNDALGLRGINAALLARQGWVRIHQGDLERAADAYERALDLARPLHNRPVIFHAAAGMAVIHRLSDRHAAAEQAACEAIGLHLAGEPRRLSNRVDAHADVLTSAAASASVIAGAAADAGRAEHAARLFGHVARMRQEAAARFPALLADDVRRSLADVVGRLGAAVLAEELARGEHGDLAADLAADLAVPT
jgi:tetratricopeptide (TPR) repeat protein